MRSSYKLLLVSGVFATSAWAQTDWIPVAQTDDNAWHVKPGSLEVSRTKGEIPIVVVVGRISDKRTKQITVKKWYVSIADCQRELGKLVTLNVDGTYAYENDFVFSSGSVASSMAESICSGYAYQVNYRDKKGI